MRKEEQKVRGRRGCSVVREKAVGGVFIIARQAFASLVVEEAVTRRRLPNLSRLFFS